MRTRRNGQDLGLGDPLGAVASFKKEWGGITGWRGVEIIVVQKGQDPRGGLCDAGGEARNLRSGMSREGAQDRTLGGHQPDRVC